MTAQSPLPKDHPLLNAWERFKQTEDYANSKKWAAHPEHLEGSLWALFMEGYRIGMAQSTCYVADSIDHPQSITFNNGRVVTLYADGDGSPYLEIEAVSVDGLGVRVKP